MFFQNKKLQLAGVLLLAAVLRFVFLADNPPGLFRDEADKGYTTYSLIKTGKDLGGHKWPLQIQSFGAYTSPFYHWLSIPSIRILGLNVFSTRLIAAIAGVLACGAWASEKLGLLSALILAVSPWHLLFSRWANQGILMTLFIPLALWATWRALEISEDKRLKSLAWILLAGMFWGISWNTYAPARLFVPLFMASIFLIQIAFSPRRFSDGIRLVLAGLTSVAVASPFILDILFHWEETQTRLKFLTGGEPLTWGGFLLNYLKHWDPGYLFLYGDENLRHHVPGEGQLNVFEVVFGLIGIFGLFKTTGLWRGWLLAWLLLSPVPAAITNEGLPHALRTLMIVPGFSLLAGVGVALAAHWLTQKSSVLSFAAIAILLVAQTVFVGYLFFQKFPNDEKAAYAWETGLVEALKWTEVSRGPTELCTLTGVLEYPEAYLQFVLKPDPGSIQRGGGYPGYHFLPLGRATDPRRDTAEGLYLERAYFAGKPPNWKKVPPPEEYEKMDLYWRLYRVTTP
ncbi:MAG: glycosyltransferase family 39 protein [Candidatus Omnitrophica bacterium]|nr:glycosyltransferase family 39 protein [Candidatus Omnitrophota bacterium]